MKLAVTFCVTSAWCLRRYTVDLWNKHSRDTYSAHRYNKSILKFSCFFVSWMNVKAIKVSKMTKSLREHWTSEEVRNRDKKERRESEAYFREIVALDRFHRRNYVQSLFGIIVQGPRNLYGRDGKFRPTFERAWTEKRLFSVPLLMTWMLPKYTKLHRFARIFVKKISGGNIRPGPLKLGRS